MSGRALWSWKSFFSGILFSVMLATTALWVLGGDPLFAGGSALLDARLVEEQAGRQSLIVIDELVSWAACVCHARACTLCQLPAGCPFFS